MTISTKAQEAISIEDAVDPEHWLEQYGDYLFRRALLLSGKPEVAEDLVQETLLAAYQSKENFRNESSIKTWLGTILRNKIIDYMRKAVRREIPTAFDEAQKDEEDKDFTAWGIWRNSQEKWGIWGKSAHDDLENQGLQEALLKCVEKLPETQKAVLKLKVVEDLTVEEICKELDLAPSNVGVLLFRARLALRSCLETNWYKKI